jgi:hypothetical protein
MTKILAAILAAALLAGIAVMLPGFDSVQAHGMGSKGDRLDLRNYGPACSERGWPYYERSCLRDASVANREARTVRIVGTDRLSPAAAR